MVGLKVRFAGLQPLRALLGTGLLCCVVSIAVQAQRVPQAQSAVDLSQKIQLKGHKAIWAQSAANAGAVAADLPLQHLTVLLTRTPAQQQALEQLLQAQQTPGSPQYHHWLTPQQVGQRFGASQQNITAVTGWLQSQGLHVDGVSNSRMRITFHGSAAAVGKALGTEFHYYNVQEQVQGRQQTEQRISINTEPMIPAALAGAIQGFIGLSQIHLHPMVHSRILPMSASPQFSNCTGSTISTCNFYVLPADFATIYDLNPVYNAGINGAGEHIALVGRSLVVNSDITEYEQIAGLPSQLPNEIIPTDGTNPGVTNDGNQDEATLDVDRSFGTASGAGVDLIASASSQTEDGVDITTNYAIDVQVDPILSISFGDCESDAGQPAVQDWDTLAQQGAAEGISIFVAAGDTGAYGCGAVGSIPPATPTSPSPNYLCSTSYVTCVGGTEFNDTANPGQYWSANNNTTTLGSALSYIPEGAWNEPYNTNIASYQLAASGGGVSAYITKPSWQAGTGVPNDGFRDTPDVAFSAAGHDGYFGCLAYTGGDCSQGQFVAFSGTSAASPSMAGVQALIDQKFKGPQGNINVEIYALAASTPTAFHDVTVATSGVTSCSLATPSMCNNSTPGPNSLTGGLAGYMLTTGYDQVTGWGSLDVANLLSAWTGSTTHYSAVATVTSNFSNTTPAMPVTFTASVHAAGAPPTGTVQFFSNGTALGAAVTVSANAATSPAESFSVGTYAITAQYSGDSNYGAVTSSAITETVTAQMTPTVTLNSFVTSSVVGQNAQFSLNVSGGSAAPTGTVQIYSNGVALGSPLTLASGTVNFVENFSVAGSFLITAQYSGDSNYSAATSNSIDFLVLPPPMSFTLSAPDLTIATPGETTGNTNTITIDGQNGFQGGVVLTCSIQYAGTGTPNAPPTCSLGNSGNAYINSGQTSTTEALTISTTGPSTVTAGLRGNKKLPETVFVAFLMLLPLGQLRRSRIQKRRLWQIGFGVVLLLWLGGSGIGCSGSQPPASLTVPGTSTGSYTVTVNGTSGNLTATTTFMLNVQ